MPGEFTLGETTLGDTLAAVAGPPPTANLGASALIDRQNIKARWGERYTSDAVNKKFVGFPRGVYYGFVPAASGLRLDLKPDISISFTALTGGPEIGEVITGGTSGATANLRVISSGFFLIDTVFDDFQVGETITGSTSGFTAEVTAYSSDRISFARVTSSTPTVSGRSEHMLDVMTTDTSSIDFTGFVDGTYYVYVTGSYTIGSTTIATVQSRTTPPPNRVTEVLVCVVIKDSASSPPLVIQATAPTTRQEPFASAGQRIGFMPGGSIESLLAATATTQEVIASRQSVDGTVAVDFDLLSPQETGLPDRLRGDLSRESMASRLGKSLVVMRGNDYEVSSPLSTLLNVSGSFSARTRDYPPFMDVTNESLPTDVPVPIVLEPEASDDITLALVGTTGAFGVGEVIEGADSGAKAIIRAVSVLSLRVNELVGVFRVGEVVNSAGPPVGQSTIAGISNMEGAITAADGGGSGDPVRNIVSVVDTYTGKKPVDTNGNPIYGRLLFGPSGTAAPGGGAPGALLVATGGGEQLNFVQGSPTVTSTLLNLTNYFLPGDLIEGADGRFYEVSPNAGSVTSTSLTLTTGKEYLGPNASATNRRRLRYQLRLVSLSAGSETQQTITPGVTIPSGADLRIFFPAWLNTSQSLYDAQLDMNSPGDAFALAQETVPGVAYNAPGLGGGSGTGLPVVGAIRTIQQNGSSVGNGNYHTINFTAGAISSPSPGVINITSAGPTGPPGSGGAGSVGQTGPVGPGYSTIYAYQTKEVAIDGGGVAQDPLTFNFSGPIRFFMVCSHLKEAQGSIDTGGVINVNAVSGNSSITVTVRHNDAGSPQGQVVVVGAAAAG